MGALLSREPGNNAVAVLAIGGTGKTTILKALGRHPAIWNAFPDGVCFIELGRDVTLQAFLDRLRSFVQDALPQFLETFVSLAASNNTHRDMIDELLERMEKKKFLIILDDLWNTIPRVLNMVQTVCEAVQKIDGGSLKVLTSTRDSGFACESMHTVTIDSNLLASNVETAHQILFQHAGIEGLSLDSLSEEDIHGLDGIVKTCAGLPLELSLAGASICQMEAPTSAVEGPIHHGRFARFWERLERSVEEVENNEIVGEKGLFASLQLSLEMMKGKWKVDNVTTDSMFRSMSILMKQSTLPIRELEKIWGLDRKCIEDCIITMSRYNVISTVADDSGAIIGLRMHDLVHDVSVELAEKTGSVRVWHDRLIRGYIDSGEVDGCDEGCHEWWKLKKENEYMRENIVHHLLGAGRGGEAIGLLTDYRWIQYVNEDENRAAFQKVISDMELLKKYLKNLSDVEMGKRLLRDINVIGQTMELCMEPYCLKNRVESTFQLQGRLASLCSQSDVVKRLLWSVEKYANRPWVRTRRGMLKSAKERLKRVSHVRHEASLMEKGIGNDEVVVSGTGGTQLINTLDGWEMFDFDKSVMEFVGICADKEQEEIYLCGFDGYVDVWKKRELLGTFLFSGLEEEEQIENVRMLQKRQIIVGGSNRGRLHVMDLSRGETIKTVEAHTSDCVECLESGNVGDAVVSLSGGSLRMWDTKQFEVEWERDLGEEVECVILSGNERMIAMGFCNGSISLLDAEEGKDISESIEDSEDDVWCLAFSKHDELLYSGSSKEVLVWDVRNIDDGVKLLHKFHPGCMVHVDSLIVSADDSELLVLGNDSIFVWDVELQFGELEEESDGQTNFYGDVHCWDISANEKTIVTFSDRTNFIEMRNVCDVPDRIENVIAEYKLENHIYCKAIAVSSNQRLVAFSLGLRRTNHFSIVRVLDIANGTTLRNFYDFDDWRMRISPRYFVYSSVSDISFTRNRFITAEAYVNIGGQEFTETISWNLRTGKLVSQLPSLPSVPSNWTPKLFFVKNSPSDQTYSCIVYMHQNSDSSRVATLEHEPINIHYTATDSRLWFSRRFGGLDYIDLITDETNIQSSRQPALPIFPEVLALDG